ncbi:FAD binding domain-containing protein [Acidovorax sp.]|uniref:FAD binding domain-containing protein n=1 Tax=Acidovorax sp. TaxID=1872122 RepID=UPI0026300678|nr:FAD binding domain-containing protein [Acidovorax sp.]
MNRVDCLRPASLADALALMAAPGVGEHDGKGGHVWLAGGQSLLAAMKLGMAAPSVLVDLQGLSELRDIRVEVGPDGVPALWVGAMATHASVAASDTVRDFAPGLAALAGGIADAQVRNMGTIGGALAHNDPAACWPAGVLAAGATIVTSQREVVADDYFQGLYTTALVPGELIVGVRFPQMKSGLRYLKFEQPASRFALVGVAVAWVGPGQVRVAATGLGMGVVRWHGAEQALAERFELAAMQSPSMAAGLAALGDIHASAEYRRHLAWVLARRCVTALTGESFPRLAPLAPTVRAEPTSLQAPVGETPADGFGGRQLLAAPPAQVWQAILDARNLQASIPGCEALAQRSATAYEATVKVGLGPLSVRFKSDVTLSDLQPPQSLTMVFVGQAGALGSGQGTARVRFEPTADGGTLLHWWVQVQLSGRLAQFGNRLVEASSRKLSEEFFQRFSAVLGAPLAGTPPEEGGPRLFRWGRRLQRLIARWF